MRIPVITSYEYFLKRRGTTSYPPAFNMSSKQQHRLTYRINIFNNIGRYFKQIDKYRLYYLNINVYYELFFTHKHNTLFYI